MINNKIQKLKHVPVPETGRYYLTEVFNKINELVDSHNQKETRSGISDITIQSLKVGGTPGDLGGNGTGTYRDFAETGATGSAGNGTSYPDCIEGKANHHKKEEPKEVDVEALLDEYKEIEIPLQTVRDRDRKKEIIRIFKQALQQ